ncbi:MAG TPA: RluA family pseudouridine synthase, partial [Clostridia bacterium]|nr:RluA family pseudouridine synthase [Clostridia bacterium]
PGIVHRLDKDTSGLMLVAKTDRAHQGLSAQIAARDVRKTYLAAVQGAFAEPAGVIEAPIARHPTDRKRMAVVEGGKPATSVYRLRMPLKGASLLEVDLITGRTHQIRVHMAWQGHPLLGDALYGNKQAAAPRLMLHAWKLAFAHPVTGAPLALEATPPEDFERALRKLSPDPTDGKP